MSAPGYNSYRESGVEWPDRVPSHWTVKPLKRVFSVVTERTPRRSWALGLENIEGWSGRLLETETEFEGEGVAFEASDILYGKLRPYLAKVHVAERPGEAVGDFHVLRAHQADVVSQYVAYQLLTREMVSQLNGSTFGARMPRVGWDFMGSVSFAFPPPAEQAAIAAFLDRETGKIDALVEAQTRLIELLKEKRQAVISHAVTKGLDPAAPMKDSGVEWLGQVPAHWEVVPLRACLGERVEKNTQGTNENYLSLVAGRGVIPYADKGDIGNKKPEDLSKCKLVEPGDIVINSMNFGIGSFGRSTYAGICSPVYVVLRDIGRGVEMDFASQLFATRALQTYAQSFGNGILAHRSAIGWDTLKGISIGLPPLAEQREIIARVRILSAQTEEMIKAAEHASSLLRERRAALISAAVTGKIDVRGLASEQAEAA